MSEQRDVAIGFAVAGAALAVSASLAWGALRQMGSGQDDDLWSGGQFASLAGLGLVILLVGLVRGWQAVQQGSWTLSLTGFAAQLHVAAAVAVFGLAWDNGRENYWEPGSFGVLIWVWTLSALVAVVAHIGAGRRGNAFSQLLLGIAGLQLLGSVVAWAYTWSGALQQLQGDVVRAIFLATHG